MMEEGTADFPCIPKFHEDLLEYIFYYVPTENLRSLREVNSTWKKVAETELRKRTFPTWIGCFYKPDLCVLEKGPNDGYSNSSLCIVCFSDSFPLNMWACLHGARRNNLPFMLYVECELASRDIDCCALQCTSVSTVSTAHKLAPVIYQAIYLPVIPHIRSTMLYYSRGVRLCDKIKNNEQIKCALVFTHECLKYIAGLCFSNVPNTQFTEDAIVAGALTSAVSLFTSNENGSGGGGKHPVILFLQEKGVAVNFNVQAIAVRHAGDTPDFEFDMKLLKLKETADPRHCGIILAFHHDIDVNRIKNVFPTYTLLAFQSKEQFCYRARSGKALSGLPIHWKRTVLVLMTWGKKV